MTSKQWISSKEILTIGQQYQGGYIFQISEHNQAGKIVAKNAEKGLYWWSDAFQLCKDKIVLTDDFGPIDDWRLPSSVDELRRVYNFNFSDRLSSGYIDGLSNLEACWTSVISTNPYDHHIQQAQFVYVASREASIDAIDEQHRTRQYGVIAVRDFYR
jgi:hypothetical protein